MIVFSIVSNHQWTPSIGDPSFMGWLTVVAYLGTALLCLTCASLTNDRLPKPYQQQHHWFWLSLALLFVFLGVNKQLDLQSLLTVVGRDAVRSSGLNPYKRVIQALFLLALTVLGWMTFSITIWRLRWLYHHYRTTFLGLAFLIVFILARASSFHHFDWLINVEVLGLRINWILELGGIACVAFSAGKLLFGVIQTRR